MSKKLTYPEVKILFDATMDGLFNDATKMVHGWDRGEFFEALLVEMMGAYEEETYDIALQAPSSIQ